MQFYYRLSNFCITFTPCSRYMYLKKCVGKTEALPKKAVGIIEASEKGVGSIATIKFSEFLQPLCRKN